MSETNINLGGIMKVRIFKERMRDIKDSIDNETEVFTCNVIRYSLGIHFKWLYQDEILGGTIFQCDLWNYGEDNEMNDYEIKACRLTMLDLFEVLVLSEYTEKGEIIINNLLDK